LHDLGGGGGGQWQVVLLLAQGSKTGGRMDISNERQKYDFLH